LNFRPTYTESQEASLKHLWGQVYFLAIRQPEKAEGLAFGEKGKRGFIFKFIFFVNLTLACFIINKSYS